jgi:hypothetical protein
MQWISSKRLFATGRLRCSADRQSEKLIFSAECPVPRFECQKRKSAPGEIEGLLSTFRWSFGNFVEWLQWVFMHSAQL